MKQKKDINLESPSHKLVFLGIATLILFIESIVTLVKGYNDGFRRKEVLSRRSLHGFNFAIKIKQ